MLIDKKPGAVKSKVDVLYDFPVEPLSVDKDEVDPLDSVLRAQSLKRHTGDFCADNPSLEVGDLIPVIHDRFEDERPDPVVPIRNRPLLLLI